MSATSDPAEPRGTLRDLGVGLLWVLPVAVLAGSASALFLWALECVTALRFATPWLVYLLPLAGPLIVAAYRRWGGASERGTNLLIDEVHQPCAGVPVRMAPLVLATTLVTHLFGGSAGREGTAVQMGGGLAGGVIRAFGVARRHRGTLLLAGMAAGFGSVFGTPFAGAVFAVEVLSLGKVRRGAWLPCLLAGGVGDWACSAWGVHHATYPIAPLAPGAWGLGPLDVRCLGAAALAGVAFGAAARLFSTAVHAVQDLLRRHVALPELRPVVGGALVVAMAGILGTRSYLGLGASSPDPQDVTLLSCFQPGGATAWSWCWKLVFTAVTLGSGFRGGEVTPLFFIGAALGNGLAGPLGVPVDLLAGLGFVAVFAGASNTPAACAVMGIELFGAAWAPYLVVACGVAYLASGHSGIYGAQRIDVPKWPGLPIPAGISLAEWRRRRMAAPPKG